MPRCSPSAHAPQNGLATEQEAGPRPEPSAELAAFWHALPKERRGQLLSIDRKSLFTRIRQQFCSRCFGLFVLRYEEMKGAAALDCPACQEFYAGLAVSEGGVITVERDVLESEPFTLFAEGKIREREREMRYMTGDICGSGFQKRPGNNMCALHCSQVPVEALVEYFSELPDDHKAALLTLREEDFAAELDAHLKYQLRICRDCRYNVTRAYRELKQPGRSVHCCDSNVLELCKGFSLRVAERLVTVAGEGISEFFNRAEDVEGCKGFDSENPYDGPDHVRHAETPELAREALVDSAVLIYRSQIEVAFREQTAGHNALLLFVGLALQVMEEQLLNAFKELEAKEAEAELLDLVAKEKEKSQASSKKKKGKKAAKASTGERTDTENAGSKASPSRQQCRQCIALQRGCDDPMPRPASPLRPKPPAAIADPVPSYAARILESDSGEWEVQHGKRRGAPQALRKSSAAAGIWNSSSASSPERRRSSLEGAELRSRSPFSKHAATPAAAESAKRGLSQRPAAVPLIAYSCLGVVQPPPPPPPREPRQSCCIPAEPSPKNAWRSVRRQPEVVLGNAKVAHQNWTPWSGPPNPLDSALPADRQSVEPRPTAARAAGHVPLPSKVQAVVAPSLLGPETFSLFHFPPVPDVAGRLSNGMAERESSSYQLFGSAHSTYPLAPISAVLSL